MAYPLDILDTQLLVYIANESKPWATEIHDEIVDGERIVFLPRYVATEFHQIMDRNQGQEGCDIAWRHLAALKETPAAVVPHPNRFRVDVDEIRKHATTRTLATVCDMEPKDAPIFAKAYRLTEFIDRYDPPGHPQEAIPETPEEFRLKRLLAEAGIEAITARILTNEKKFINTNASELDIEDVTVERVP